MKTAIIIHGWSGNPNKGWFVWLEEELKKRGFNVIKPKMPEPDTPKISKWVSKLKSEIKNPDENLYFIGHSIGCQTILRCMETLKTKNKLKIGGIILVAPWLTLSKKVTNKPEEFKIAKPWLNTKIDFEKTKNATKNIVAIFSDNDYFVPIENANMFKTKLDAKIIIEKNKAHFEESKTKSIPSILKELEMMK